MSKPWTYERAGLDLAKYAATVAGIQPLLARTWDAARVVPPPFPPRAGGKGSGGFASLFDFNPDGRYTHPILVTCTDGVGSKLKIASLMGNAFDTVGIDLVAMSVNDLICTGGEPLDVPRLSWPWTGRRPGPDASNSCRASAMPAWSADCCARRRGNGDPAGLLRSPATSTWPGSPRASSNAVARDRRQPRPRWATPIIGLASSGIHSNGYSLVRKIVFEAAETGRVPTACRTSAAPVGASELLTPTTALRPRREARCWSITR